MKQPRTLWRRIQISAKKALERFTGGWATRHETAVSLETITVQMEAAAIPSFGFFLMLALSAVIATLGLLGDSAPAIIGAMIIAPLMAPIVSMAFGIATEDVKLVSISFTTVVVGAAVVVLISYVSVLFFGFRIAGDEILSRTSPNMLDLGVALAAGCAGAFAQTRPSIANSIAGVAIAVALVPPLAVTGIGLALGRKATTVTGLSLSEFGLYSGGIDVATGAFVLFATNLIGIVLIATMVFIFHRYGKIRQMISVAVIVFASAFLIPPLSAALHEVYVKNRVARLHAQSREYLMNSISESLVKIERIHAGYRDGVLLVNVDMFATRDELIDAQAGLDRFRERLSREIGEPVIIEIDVVPVEFLRLRSAPANL